MNSIFLNSRTALVSVPSVSFDAKDLNTQIKKIAQDINQHGNVIKWSIFLNNEDTDIVFSLMEDGVKYAADNLLRKVEKNHTPSPDYVEFLNKQKNKPIEIMDKDLPQLYEDAGLSFKQEMRKDNENEDLYQVSDKEIEDRLQQVMDARLKNKKFSPELDNKVMTDVDLFDVNKDLTEAHPLTQEKYDSPEEIQNTEEGFMPEDIKERGQKVKKEYEEQKPLNEKIYNKFEEYVYNWEKKNKKYLNEKNKKDILNKLLMQNIQVDPDLFWDWYEDTKELKKEIPLTPEEKEAAIFQHKDLCKFGDITTDTNTPGDEKTMIVDGQPKKLKTLQGPDGTNIHQLTNTINGETAAMGEQSPEWKRITENKNNSVVDGTTTTV